MDHELLPCPFCGEIAEIEQPWFNGYKIKCLGCYAFMAQKQLKIGMPKLKNKLVEAWNKRELK